MSKFAATRQHRIDRVSPQSILSERSALAAMIINNDVISTVIDLLGTDENRFYQSEHQVIYDAICAMHRDGIPVDGVTLLERLSSIGKLDQAGGASHVSDVAASAPTSANAEHYAKAILDRSIRRNLIDAGNRIAIVAGNNDKDTVSVLVEAEHAIARLSEQCLVNMGPRIIDPVLYDQRTEPVRWVFDGLVAKQMVAGLAAQGGTGKSFLLLQAAMCAAAGVSIPECYPFAVQSPQRVLCFFGEDSRDETLRRMQRVYRGLGLNQHDGAKDRIKENLVISAGHAGALMEDCNAPRKTEYFRRMASLVSRVQPDLIIVDPKSHFFGLDENSNTHTSQWYVTLKSLFDVSDCAIIVSQHVAKARQSDMDSASVRGAAANRDDARAFFSMAPMDPREADRYGVTNPRLYVRFDLTKSNYSASLPATVWYQRMTDHDGTPEDISVGGVLRRVDMARQQSDAECAQRDAAVEALCDAIGTNPHNITQREIEYGANGQIIRDYIRDILHLKKFTCRQTQETLAYAEQTGSVRIDVVSDGRGKPRAIPRAVEQRSLG